MNAFFKSIYSIFLSNVRCLPQPYKLTFALTYHCNSRCTICSIWRKPRKNELTLEQIQYFFEQNPYFNWINLTGGELNLRTDLVEIIDTIIKTQPHLYYLNFPTNGLMPEKIVKNVKDIIQLRPQHFIVSVSLDGPEKLHDKLRGIPGNWKQAVKTYTELKKLRSSTFDCYFGMTVSHHNYSYIEQTYQELKTQISTLQRTDIHFNIAHYSSHYYGNVKQHISVPNETINAIHTFNKKKGRTFTKISLIEHLYQRLIPHYLRTRKTPIPCVALSSSLFLDPYGNIFPCSMWNYPLGNIKDYQGNLMNMWNSKNTWKALNIIKLKKCANCWTPCEAYQSILGNMHNPTIWKSLFAK